MIITGGTEAAITEMGLSGFQNMKALSSRNEDPQRSQPALTPSATASFLSEGAGLLVLEELEHAKQRRARIYCEVLGFGASADAGHITQPDERGAGAGRAMSDALADAKLNPRTSATSTLTAPVRHWAMRPRRKPSSASSASMPRA